MTAALQVGSGPLQGTTTVTVSGGIATFTNLADNKAETISLQFTSSPALTAAISSNIVVSPAAATQLVIHTQPAATATAFVPFNPQPVIYVEDQFGNRETGDNTTQVTASLNTGSGPLSGTTTVTAAAGVATFTNLADTTAETITLQIHKRSRAQLGDLECRSWSASSTRTSSSCRLSPHRAQRPASRSRPSR